MGSHHKGHCMAMVVCCTHPFAPGAQEFHSVTGFCIPLFPWQSI